MPDAEFDMAQRQRKKSSPPIGGHGKGLPQSEEPAGLQFLTFTHVNQTTDPETKRKVRSHVMHGVQQKLRSEKGREKGKEKGKFVLDISLLSQPDRGTSTHELAPPILLHLGTLGAGRSDPFKQYPIAMDVRTHELYDHCKISVVCIFVRRLLNCGSAWQDLPNVQDIEQNWILPNCS